MLGIQQTSSPLLLNVGTLEQSTTCSPHLNPLYLRQLTGLNTLTYLNHGPEISTHKDHERKEVVYAFCREFGKMSQIHVFRGVRPDYYDIT